MIWSVIDYYIQNDCNKVDQDSQNDVVQINQFKEELLKTLAKMLSEYEIAIDYEKLKQT